MGVAENAAKGPNDEKTIAQRHGIYQNKRAVVTRYSDRHLTYAIPSIVNRLITITSVSQYVQVSLEIQRAGELISLLGLSTAHLRLNIEHHANPRLASLCMLQHTVLYIME